MDLAKMRDATYFDRHPSSYTPKVKKLKSMAYSITPKECALKP